MKKIISIAAVAALLAGCQLFNSGFAGTYVNKANKQEIIITKNGDGFLISNKDGQAVSATQQDDKLIVDVPFGGKLIISKLDNGELSYCPFMLGCSNDKDRGLWTLKK